jgi:stage V sporulation protein G
VEITEIRIKLMEDNNERLQAFCSVTFDDMFVVRDLKIIEGAKGSFVAMPSRKLMDRCPQCSCKNHLRARFCNQCGARLSDDRAVRDPDGRAKLHADIAHPINSACREVIQGAVIRAHQEELERSKQPGYVCRYDEVDAGDAEESYEQVINSLHGPERRSDGYRKAPLAAEPRNNHRSEAPPVASVGSGRGEESPSEPFGAGILD